jgi:hypothetical protein
MDLSLETRAALPDALRVLLRDYPREGWERDPGFHGLVSFWLGMHLHFRDALGALRADAEALLDRRIDSHAWAPRMARAGGGFVQHLHGPSRHRGRALLSPLVQRDARLVRGFDILDSDHKALDGHLNGFVEEANAALRALETKEPCEPKPAASTRASCGSNPSSTGISRTRRSSSSP